MSPGGTNRGSCTSKTGTSLVHGRRRGQQLAQVGPVPGAHGLAQQPGAHDVGQEPHRAVDAALVGEVGRARRAGEHGRVELEADESPVPSERYADASSASGVPTTAEAVSWDPTATSDSRSTPSEEATSADTSPTTSPGSDQVREDLPRQAQHRDELVVPPPGARVEQTGRRGVGDLGDLTAGQPVAEQVGHQQQAGRRRGPRGLRPAGRPC